MTQQVDGIILGMQSSVLHSQQPCESLVMM